jgi:acyl carrier protein
MLFFGKKNPAESEVEAPASAGVGTAALGPVLGALRVVVSRLSRDHVPAANIEVNAHLLDSGYIDSLSATELLAEIERQYKVRIDEMDIVGRLCTLSALAREIETRTVGAPK